MELPTLEKRIKELARQKIKADIVDLHDLIYGKAGMPDPFFKLLKGVTIRVRLGEDDVERTIDLPLLFSDEAIKNRIIEERLPEYVKKEIEEILEKPQNKG